MDRKNFKIKVFLLGSVLLTILIFSFLFLWQAPSSKMPPLKFIRQKLPRAGDIFKKEAEPSSQSYKDKVIVLDPGHQKRANLDFEPIGPGSSQMKEKVRAGTRGVISGRPEYEITLEISLKLKALLEDDGIKVVMTRDKNDIDISNIERAKIANQAQAALFVRIHADGSEDSSMNGISTLYPARNQWTEGIYSESLRAARIIQAELIKITGRRDNGITARDDLTGFNWSKVPVVLVEAGFLSNPEEDRLLNKPEFQQKITQGIFNGIKKYLAGALSR